jgi:hypothetical protein
MKNKNTAIRAFKKGKKKERHIIFDYNKNYLHANGAQKTREQALSETSTHYDYVVLNKKKGTTFATIKQTNKK